MNSPLCHNLFKALVLEGQRSREKYAVGPASPDYPPPHPHPHPFFQLSTAVWQPPSNPPTPSQLICHLHSSLQDNSNEPKESTSKVWTDSATRTFSLTVGLLCSGAADEKRLVLDVCDFLHLSVFCILTFCDTDSSSGLIHVSPLPIFCSWLLH